MQAAESPYRQVSKTSKVHVRGVIPFAGFVAFFLWWPVMQAAESPYWQVLAIPKAITDLEVHVTDQHGPFLEAITCIQFVFNLLLSFWTADGIESTCSCTCRY